MAQLDKNLLHEIRQAEKYVCRREDLDKYLPSEIEEVMRSLFYSTENPNQMRQESWRMFYGTGNPESIMQRIGGIDLRRPTVRDAVALDLVKLDDDSVSNDLRYTYSQRIDFSGWEYQRFLLNRNFRINLVNLEPEWSIVKYGVRPSSVGVNCNMLKHTLDGVYQGVRLSPSVMKYFEKLFQLAFDQNGELYDDWYERLQDEYVPFTNANDFVTEIALIPNTRPDFPAITSRAYYDKMYIRYCSQMEKHGIYNIASFALVDPDKDKNHTGEYLLKFQRQFAENSYGYIVAKMDKDGKILSVSSGERFRMWHSNVNEILSVCEDDFKPRIIDVAEDTAADTWEPQKGDIPMVHSTTSSHYSIFRQRIPDYDLKQVRHYCQFRNRLEGMELELEVLDRNIHLKEVQMSQCFAKETMVLSRLFKEFTSNDREMELVTKFYDLVAEADQVTERRSRLEGKMNAKRELLNQLIAEYNGISNNQFDRKLDLGRKIHSLKIEIGRNLETSRGEMTIRLANIENEQSEILSQLEKIDQDEPIDTSTLSDVDEAAMHQRLAEKIQEIKNRFGYASRDVADDSIDIKIPGLDVDKATELFNNISSGITAASTNLVDHLTSASTITSTTVKYVDNSQVELNITGTLTQASIPNRENVREISIGNRVVGIESGALYGCTNLTSVTIPDTVASIGGSAFSECTRLEAVYIPGSVESIGDHAFENCGGLTSVTIGNGVKSIGSQAFENCESLETVVVPDSVEIVGTESFHKCGALTEVTLGRGVKAIGDRAFELCTSLQLVAIFDSVWDIGTDAFHNSAVNHVEIKANGGNEDRVKTKMMRAGVSSETSIEWISPSYDDMIKTDELQVLVLQSERWRGFMFNLGYELDRFKKMKVMCDDATVKVRRLVHNFEEKMHVIESEIWDENHQLKDGFSFTGISSATIREIILLYDWYAANAPQKSYSQLGFTNDAEFMQFRRRCATIARNLRRNQYAQMLQVRRDRLQNRINEITDTLDMEYALEYKDKYGKDAESDGFKNGKSYVPNDGKHKPDLTMYAAAEQVLSDISRKVAEVNSIWTRPGLMSYVEAENAISDSMNHQYDLLPRINCNFTHSSLTSYVMAQPDISVQDLPEKHVFSAYPDLMSYVQAQREIHVAPSPNTHVFSTYPNLMSYVLSQPNVSVSKVSIEPYMHSDLMSYVLAQTDISVKNLPTVRSLCDYLPDLTSYVLAQPNVSVSEISIKPYMHSDLMSYVLAQPNVSVNKVFIEPYMHLDLSGYAAALADLPLPSASRIEPHSFQQAQLMQYLGAETLLDAVVSARDPVTFFPERAHWCESYVNALTQLGDREKQKRQYDMDAEHLVERTMKYLKKLGIAQNEDDIQKLVVRNKAVHYEGDISSKLGSIEATKNKLDAAVEIMIRQRKSIQTIMDDLTRASSRINGLKARNREIFNACLVEKSSAVRKTMFLEKLENDQTILKLESMIKGSRKAHLTDFSDLERMRADVDGLQREYDMQVGEFKQEIGINQQSIKELMTAIYNRFQSEILSEVGV